MRPPRRPANSPRSLYLLAASALLVVFVFFLTRPFVESASSATSAPRWLLLFAPLDDPTFMEFVWRGLDLPAEPPTGERRFALGLGVVATLALLGLGKLAFAPFKRLLKTNVFETIFFQFGAGFALWNFYVQIAGFLGRADAPVALATFVFAAFYVFSTAFAASRCFVAAKNRVNDAPSTPLFPRQRLGDRVLLTLQVILLTIFTSFYFFSSTQPLFEYDVVEYHAQAAREIFETGVLSFSPNNVYANMPLGAETLYVGGFNLVRDLCAAPDAPLRLGSLVGKVVLTAAAFATALGLFAFCVRFFYSGRAGLFTALFYLAFPGLFDVFANGLNDGALGFALFAAFYAFALSLASDATRWSRLVFRVATASFVGVYVGLAVSIKYTAVVFVFAPAFVALLAVSFPTLATPLRRLFRDAESTPLNDAATAETSTGCDATFDAAPSLVSPSKPAVSRLLKDACAPLAVFVATVALVSGGWFLRNVSATGNPFYPLAFELFGDASQTWDADV
ncbi:MAG: glycosyltransferase family 39 protein, partial [Thermoguttaceae bacterium]|nr:glycosyltransferase family 39 protein [Thermoguttaceae bacterium]